LILTEKLKKFQNLFSLFTASSTNSREYEKHIKLLAEPKDFNDKTMENLIMPKNPFELPSPYSSQPKRDSRRSFTSTQKKEILYQQNSKCARCHKKLDPRAIHFHHKKPWSSGGRTITVNGRALCADCHEILSHKERLKKVDKKRRKKSSSIFDLPKIKLPKSYLS